MHQVLATVTDGAGFEALTLTGSTPARQEVSSEKVLRAAELREELSGEEKEPFAASAVAAGAGSGCGRPLVVPGTLPVTFAVTHAAALLRDQQQLESRAAFRGPLAPPTHLAPPRTAATAHTTTAAADVAHLDTHTHTHTSGVCDSLLVVSQEVPATVPGGSCYFWTLTV